MIGVRAGCALVLAIASVTLYYASDWWERAFATLESSELSPDGCIRMNTYRPFWILPEELHRIPDADPRFRNNLGMEWDAAIFERGYEEKTGAFLGETVVYDPVGHSFIDWGNTGTPGRRVVTVNGFPFIDTDRCADKETLSLLEAAYRRKMQGN